MTRSFGSDTRHLTPDTEGLCSQKPMMDGPEPVASDNPGSLNPEEYAAIVAYF